MERECEADAYWVPEGARAYLYGVGYSTRALEDIEGYISGGGILGCGPRASSTTTGTPTGSVGFVRCEIHSN